IGLHAAAGILEILVFIFAIGSFHFLLAGEIAFMHIAYGYLFIANFIKDGAVFFAVDEFLILLFKELCIFAQYVVSLLIILPVFRHCIDKEQRQHFDPFGVEPYLLIQVLLNGLGNQFPFQATVVHAAQGLPDA